MRGDAVAGILVLFINVIGGLAIGVLQHDLDISTAIDNYVLLTIGDGLVAQIPALVISIAAGLIVSRVGKDENDVGSQIVHQMFSTPRALTITAVILFLLGIIPGMPSVVFLLLAGACGYLAWMLLQRDEREREKTAAAAAAPPAAAPLEASWEDIVPVDVLGLEVGYRLIPLVDAGADGELLKRIKAIRKKFAQEIGFLPPSVHIRDNLELKPSQYRVLLKGVAVGEGEAFTGLWLAINPGGVTQSIPGPRPRTRRLACPPSGSMHVSANRRRSLDTRSWTARRSLRRTSTTCF